jgi:hypothetical protein
MMRPGSLFVMACAALILASSPAAAQIDDTSWGVTAGFSPRWSIPGNVLAELFDASELDVKGPEFRLGVVRGTTLGGEWGISLIHKRLSKESRFEVEGTDSTVSVVTDDAEMLGVEVHRFFPFGIAGNRVQFGVNLGGGIAQLRGFVTGVYVSGTVLAGERMKVRVSGGFNMPGFQVVSVTFSYLLGQDR